MKRCRFLIVAPRHQKWLLAVTARGLRHSKWVAVFGPEREATEIIVGAPIITAGYDTMGTERVADNDTPFQLLALKCCSHRAARCKRRRLVLRKRRAVFSYAILMCARPVLIGSER